MKIIRRSENFKVEELPESYLFYYIPGGFSIKDLNDGIITVLIGNVESKKRDVFIITSKIGHVPYYHNLIKDDNIENCLKNILSGLIK